MCAGATGSCSGPDAALEAARSRSERFGRRRPLDVGALSRRRRRRGVPLLPGRGQVVVVGPAPRAVRLLPGEVVPTTELLLWHHRATGKDREQTLTAIARGVRRGAGPGADHAGREGPGARGRRARGRRLDRPDPRTCRPGRRAGRDERRRRGCTGPGERADRPVGAVPRRDRAGQGHHRARLPRHPDAAFASLRRSSSLANVKVRDIAESIVAVAQDLPVGVDPRPALDRVLAGVQAA